MSLPEGCISGVDVSHWNGKVDWAAAAAAGEQFTYIKATGGLTDDPFFVENWKNSRAAGLLRGAYHYFNPEMNAARQAKVFLAHLNAANGSAVHNPGDLPPALDVETSGGMSPAAIANGMKTWLTAVEDATGRVPLIYTYSDFWTYSVGHAPDFSRHPLWIARYGPPPVVPATWPEWHIWEFSNCDAASWHGGKMDSNAYKGDLESLRTLAGLAGQS